MTNPLVRTLYGHRSDGHRSDDGEAAVPRSDSVAQQNGHARSAGTTYYDLPAIKKSGWGWLISTYFFVGGLAGAAQVLAAIADLRGRRHDRAVVRTGRYLALAGAAVSPACLIADLHTPSRWYNMLRIFRRTSPMSIGSWTLAAFGTLSGLAAVAQLVDDVTGWPAARRLARLASLPAAGLGAVMSVYTGVLVSATSVPLWATVPRQLPALFGATAVATATAAISLVLDLAGADVRPRRRLDRLALIASIVQLAISKQTERQWRQAGVSGPLEQAPTRAVQRGLVMGAGILAPLALHAAQVVTGRRLRGAGLAASLGTLAGGYGERWLVVFAGRDSAVRPRDYFAVTQPPAGADGFGMRPSSKTGAVGGGPR